MSLSSIKITALNPIGANIAYTTLIPVVNMAETPTTQKATAQVLGNLILNSAGGSYFPPAAQAVLAQSVTNAAQPNITSVGTLTALTVSGNLVAGNVNGGNWIVANYFSGDGSFLTNVTANGTYSNSNVANYLPTYTGNVGAGNVNVTGTVYANGLSSTGLSSLTTLNVSATSNLGAVGNLTITGGSNGQVLTTNGNGVLSWANGGGSGAALVNGDNSFVLNANGNVVFEGNVAGQGVNRGLVWDYGANANGVNSEVRQDNSGLSIRAYTTDGGGANGFSAPVRIVTNEDANEKEWVFDGDGNLTLPGNLRVPDGIIVSDSIAPTFDSAITGITTGNATVIVTLADSPFDGPFQGEVTISDVTGTTEANDTWYYQAVEENAFELFTDDTFSTPVDGTTWTTYVSGGNAVSTGTYSNLTIQGGNVSINSNTETWTFSADGSTIYPTLSVTRGDRTGTLTGQTLLFGDSTQEAIITTPNGTSNINSSQRFVINPGAGYANTTGEGGDIYLYAGRGGDAGGSGGDIKIRGGLGPVDGYGGYLDLQGGEAAGNGTGGYIDIRGGESANAIGGNINIDGGQGGTNGGGINIQGGYGGAGDGGNINITGGGSANGLSQYGNVNIVSGASTWNFVNDGNLILAGGNSIVRSVANSSLDTLNPNVSTMILTPDAGYSTQSLVLDPTAPGHIHLRAPGANIDEPLSNIFLGGETSSFEVGYYNGEAPNVFVHSGNNTWTFDNTGNLTLPGNLIVFNDQVQLQTDSNAGVIISDKLYTDPAYTGVQFSGYPWIYTLSSNSSTPGAEISYTDGANLDTFYSPNTYSSSIIINRNGFSIDLNYNEANGGNFQSWRFDPDGYILFPDSTVQTTAFTGVGNIATINLTGSNSDVLYGNGVFAAGSSYDQSLNTNNSVEFANVTSTGTVFTDRVEHPNVGDIIIKPWSNYNQGSSANNYNYMFGAPNQFGQSILQVPTDVIIKPNGVNSNEYVALQSNKYAELKVDSQFPVTTSIVGVEATEVYIAVDTAGQTGNRSDWSFTTLGMQFPDTTRQKTAWNGTEKFYNKTGATGVVTHDCANGAVFYHTSIAGNFTADITNLPVLANTTGAVTLVLSQGVTPYVCNAVQINSVPQTILWQGSASAPTGNANKTDIITFSIMRTGASTYIVFGQLVSFG